MAVNVELIKILRDRTGAGIMDCKNALAACENDVDKACDWLREKGIAKQAKKADRIAAEGLVLIHTCEKCGKASIVEVNCETDFVSKADAFKDLVETCAKTVLKECLKHHFYLLFDHFFMGVIQSLYISNKLWQSA